MKLDRQLNKAIEIAINVHYDQLDKAGEPYILHPLHIMNEVTGLKCKIVAVLHDVLEDCDDMESELDFLYDCYFDGDIIAAVKVLTKPKYMQYTEYICRVGENALATKVKLADLEHNMDLSRLDKITEKDIIRCEKYRKAHEYLQNICEYVK